jgi:hypothetical protein
MKRVRVSGVLVMIQIAVTMVLWASFKGLVRFVMAPQSNRRMRRYESHVER